MADAPVRLTWFSTLVAPDGARRILEVGCGNGQLLELLADRCPRAELVGIDRSERQVRCAVMRLVALPRASQVQGEEAAFRRERQGAETATFESRDLTPQRARR